MSLDESAGASRDWREGTRYVRLRGIDRAGLMWEWLRRDPAYAAWQVRASTATGGERGSSEDDPLTWGLHFRGASGSRGNRGPDPLACGSRSGHHPDYGLSCGSKGSGKSPPCLDRTLAHDRIG
ncbi:transcriptional regulator domain-containing protein [Allosphingosinicella deserti]|uniref:transcriptional regulator domain-containing protein n=1 Tax=Allosphingosinicella deserti TaxID=2116704 RepID=UPI0038CDA7BB